MPIHFFADGAAAGFFRERKTAPSLEQQRRRGVQRRLKMLDAAASLQDLESPPGGRVKAAPAGRSAQQGLRVIVQVDSHKTAKRPAARQKQTPIVRPADWPGPAIAPGEILLEEFLKPLALGQLAAARRLGISLNRLNEIVLGKRGITPDTALRLARLFKTSAQLWVRLQADWDLQRAAARAPALRARRTGGRRP